MDERLKWALIGIASLLAVKYGLLGLDWWNSLLHPGRQEPENLQVFRRPLLGLLEAR